MAAIFLRGHMFLIALLIAVALLAITGVAVWKMVAGAVWIGRSRF
jgi:hypothetical protein